MGDLERITAEVAQDDSVTAFVIASGTPGWFVLHGDLVDLIALGRGEPFEGDAGAWPRTLAMFEAMPQMVIAAINGRTGGGGLEMTLACTMRVVGPRALMSFVEVPLGLLPGGGGTQRLPRLIGPGRTAELILSGRSFGAQEALRLGVAERIIPDEPFMDGVLAWLKPIADRPATALAAAKRAIYGGLDLPLERGLEHEAAQVGPLLFDTVSHDLMAAAVERYDSTAPADEVVL